MSDFGSVAAWANALVATIGLAGILYQVRKQRQLNSANLLLSLESKYGEAHMIAARREFAEVLRLHRGTSKNALTGYQPVLSFFEMLAALVHRGVLDEKLIWHRFSWRVIRCWLAIATHPDYPKEELPAAGSLLQQMRSMEHEPTIYDQFQWLGQRFVQQDSRLHRGGQRYTLQQIQEMVEQYFIQESALR